MRIHIRFKINGEWTPWRMKKANMHISNNIEAFETRAHMTLSEAEKHYPEIKKIYIQDNDAGKL